MAATPNNDKTTVQKSGAKPSMEAHNNPKSAPKRTKTTYTEADIDYDYERSVQFANRGCLIAFAVVMVALATVLLWAFLFIKGEIDGKKAPAKTEVVIEIPSGAGGQTVSDILEKNGLIGNPVAFRLYLRINGVGGFQAGEYTIQPKTGYDDIIDMLTQDPAPKEQIKVTFPEGITTRRFGEICEENGLCTADEFVAAANDIEEYSDIKFFQYIDYDPDTYMRSEGYLAPDTYFFHSDDSPKTIVRKLYEQFNKEIEDMRFQTSSGEKTFYEMLDMTGFSFREAITLASLIEEEAGKPDENQALVAGVFVNRLKREDINTNELPRRTLGSDVTVYYLRDWVARDYGGEFDNIPENLRYAYLALDEPTSREGLPVGPISNPRVGTIKAALQPVRHDYFYFLTDFYGKYYYAKTYREHQNNIAIMTKENEKYEAENGSVEN